MDGLRDEHIGEPNDERDLWSRRGVLAALGAAAAGGAAVVFPGGAAAGAPPLLAGGAHPAVLGTSLPGLAYVGIDPLSFVAADATASYRISYTPATGIAPNLIGESYPLYAPLSLPAGSVVKQLNVSYLTQPILKITKRTLGSTTPVDVFGPFTLDAGAGAKTQTVTLPSPVTIAQDATYYVSCICTRSGESVLGMTIGYLPPTQSFVPLTSGTPRVYDSRDPGNTALQPNEDRTITLGGVGARSAVFNLAIDASQAVTTGGGFVGAYSADLAAWPKNASINWSAKGEIASNTVVCAIDAQGRIKLHGGASAVHVIVDLIGFLV